MRPLEKVGRPRCISCGGTVWNEPYMGRCKDCWLQHCWKNQRQIKKRVECVVRESPLYVPFQDEIPLHEFFPNSVFDSWDRMNASGKWSVCFGCGRSGCANTLLAIMGREHESSQSILNSCPANTPRCAEGIAGDPQYLVSTFRVVKGAVSRGLYSWKQIDLDFYEIFQEHYQYFGCYFHDRTFLRKNLSQVEYLENVLIRGGDL